MRVCMRSSGIDMRERLKSINIKEEGRAEGGGGGARRERLTGGGKAGGGVRGEHEFLQHRALFVVLSNCLGILIWPWDQRHRPRLRPVPPVSPVALGLWADIVWTGIDAR